MADAFANKSIEPAAAKSIAEVVVTFDGTAATWATGLSKVDFAGEVKTITGTGGGVCLPSTTTRGQVDLSGFTTADVVRIRACGDLM